MAMFFSLLVRLFVRLSPARTCRALVSSVIMLAAVSSRWWASPASA